MHADSSQKYPRVRSGVQNAGAAKHGGHCAKRSIARRRDQGSCSMTGVSQVNLFFFFFRSPSPVGFKLHRPGEI